MERLHQCLFVLAGTSEDTLSSADGMKVSEGHVFSHRCSWLLLSPPRVFCGAPQEALGVRMTRRRWSSRGGSAEDGVLMVKSMLDLRLLDSYSPDTKEEQQEAPEEQEEVLRPQNQP